MEKDISQVTDKTEGKLRSLENLKPFKPGDEWAGNASGRPKGSISAIGRVKQIFEECPEEFEEFIKKYIKDPNNRKHIVEMIDGKPEGSSNDTNINVVIPILGGSSAVLSDNSDTEAIEAS